MENMIGLEDFFASPFAEEYINSTDYVMRRSVAGISAACEQLRVLADKKGGRSDRELIDDIMGRCCDLMRVAELSRALAAQKLTDEDMQDVRTDVFLEGFAKSCKEASDGICNIKIKKSSACCMRTDRTLLRFLLLSFVRRHMVGGNGKKLTFEAECSESPKTLNIKIRALRTFVDEDTVGEPDVFEAYHRDTCMGLVKRLGASMELSDESISVVIPLAEGDVTASLETPAAEAGKEYFDPFSIMLGDI